MTPLEPHRVFCVMLHDVAPLFEKQVDHFIETFSPLLGTAMAAAVVPCWGGVPLVEQDRPFLGRVQKSFGNILLHGYTHVRQRGFGPVSFLASGLDEMNGLDRAETDRRLHEGQRQLERWFGSRARGFIAPTFQIGHATPDRLQRHGLSYTVGYGRVVGEQGTVQRLSTWCWDVSPFRPFCHVGHWLGELQYRFRRSSIPCVALHPLDIDRGFLPWTVSTVKKLLAAGRQPVLLESYGVGSTDGTLKLRSAGAPASLRSP